MSAKIIRILALALVVLAAAFWLHRKTITPLSDPSINSGESETTLKGRNAVASSSLTLQSPGSLRAEPLIPAGAESESPQEKYEAYVNERIAHLADLGTENDPDSLRTILSELTNGDPAIRKAALDAAIQFGNRDAIPAIQDAMLRVDDPEEKVAMAKGIDFLQLTNVTEMIELSLER